MQHISGKHGACMVSVDDAGVYVTPGANPGRFPARKMLTKKFRVGSITYTIMTVHQVEVVAGYIYFVGIARSSRGIQAFKFVNNPYEEHSSLIANENGEVYSSGFINVLDVESLPPRTLAPGSVLYDEVAHRILYEVHSSIGRDVGVAVLGWRALDAENVPAYVRPAGVHITDCMYAYNPDGSANVVFGAYNSVDQCTQIYDGTGSPVLKVAGKPDSAFGLRSNSTSADIFDIVLFYANGSYIAVNIDTNVPGDIQSVWFSAVPEEGAQRIHIQAIESGVRLLTTIVIRLPPTSVQVYTNTHMITYDAGTSAVLDTIDAPLRIPDTAVSTPDGHVTASIDAGLGGSQVVFGRYVDGLLVAEYPVPYASAILPPKDQRITRLDGRVSYAGVTIALDFNQALAGNPDVVQLISGIWTLNWSTEFGTISVTDESATHAFPLSGPNGTPPVRFIPNDDVFGGFVWFQEAVPGPVPSYRVELVTFVPNEIPGDSGYFRQLLVDFTTTRPSYCDTFHVNGELYLATVGNWQTNAVDEVAIYHLANADTESPVVTQVSTVPIDPAYPIVEQLRGEADTLVWTSEPHPSDSVGTHLEVALDADGYTESPTLGTYWAPSTPTSFGNIHCAALLCVLEHGNWQAYVELTFNTLDLSDPDVPVTVGTTSADIPAGESRIYHIATPATGWSTVVVAAPLSPDAAVAYADVQNVPITIPGAPAGSTLGSLFFPSDLSDFEGSFVRYHSIFGISQPNAAKLYIFNATTSNLETIDYPSTSIRAIAITPGVPHTSVDSVIMG